MENGLGPAKLWDVRILLTFYGIEDAESRDRMEGWARSTKSESWWESDADLTTDDVDRYLAAETEAAVVRMYCTPVVPVLLQTPAYAEAHVRRLFPTWSDSDVLRFVAIRRARQSPLSSSERPLTFEAVIDEAALLRRVGTAAVHLAQLESLVAELSAGERDGHHVSLHILPLTAGPGRALGPFTIFEPRDPSLDPRTAFIEETIGSGTWLEADDVAEFTDIYDDLLSLSLDVDASLQRLREIARSL